jgi:hypothetical protein
MEFIYGGVFPAHSSPRSAGGKQKYPAGKQTLDICFVAYRYQPGGKDKGFDVFMESARRLAARLEHARFHVVGNFSAADIDGEPLPDRMTFYGARPSSFFIDFYRSMDLILSANVPFVLAPGAFDGFPTGCCIEAAMSGVVVMCTDPLGLNIAFRDGQDIFIVPHDAAAVTQRIMDLHDNPRQLYDAARRGQQAMRNAFSDARQLEPRFRLLSSHLKADDVASKSREKRPLTGKPPQFEKDPTAPIRHLLTPHELQQLTLRTYEVLFRRNHGVGALLTNSPLNGFFSVSTPPHFLHATTTASLDLREVHPVDRIEMTYLGENLTLVAGSASLSITAFSDFQGMGESIGAFQADIEMDSKEHTLAVPVQPHRAVRSLLFTLRTREGADKLYRARVHFKHFFMHLES